MRHYNYGEPSTVPHGAAAMVDATMQLTALKFAMLQVRGSLWRYSSPVSIVALEFACELNGAIACDFAVHNAVGRP
jgi:hypothetical protein